jgi:hypothetical protein
MSCIAANRASPFLPPSSFLFALRMDAIWRFSLACFFCFVLDTPCAIVRGGRYFEFAFERGGQRPRVRA